MTLHDITLHYISFRYTSLHYMTLHDITWHYMTLHDITWHYMTLHDITWHYMTLHDMTLHDITWHYVTLHDITWHYMTTLHYITWHYITWHYITLHYISFRYTSLHYITSHHITLGYKTLRTYKHTFKRNHQNLFKKPIKHVSWVTMNLRSWIGTHNWPQPVFHTSGNCFCFHGSHLGGEVDQSWGERNNILKSMGITSWGGWWGGCWWGWGCWKMMRMRLTTMIRKTIMMSTIRTWQRKMIRRIGRIRMRQKMKMIMTRMMMMMMLTMTIDDDECDHANDCDDDDDDDDDESGDDDDDDDDEGDDDDDDDCDDDDQSRTAFSDGVDNTGGNNVWCEWGFVSSYSMKNPKESGERWHSTKEANRPGQLANLSHWAHESSKINCIHPLSSSICAHLRTSSSIVWDFSKALGLCTHVSLWHRCFPLAFHQSPLLLQLCRLVLTF